MGDATPNPFCHLPHYVTGEYTRNKTFLDDAEYARALDCFVKGCADLLLTDGKGRVLLGKRKVEPQPDWWVLGGRMKAGDTIEEAAARNLRRETGVDLPHARFSFVCAQTMLWQFRKQEPAGNGTADVGIIMTAELTEEEVAAMNMCSEEYLEYGWFEPEALMADNTLHPVVRNGVKQLVGKKVKDELHRVTMGGGSDAEIATLVRKLYR